MNLCTLIEQSLADKGDLEELIDTKVGGVHSTDNEQRPPNYASTV